MAKPSRSFVLALVALFLATAGAAGAGGALVITSAEIRNGTIQLVDLSPAAKRGLRGKRGPAGRAGAAGPPGPQGAQGARGPAGATSVVVQSVQFTIPARTTASPISPLGCPGNEGQIVGGGAATGSPEVVAYESYPADVNGQPVGGAAVPVRWAVSVSNARDVPHTVRVYALCARP